MRVVQRSLAEGGQVGGCASKRFGSDFSEHEGDADRRLDGTVLADDEVAGRQAGAGRGDLQRKPFSEFQGARRGDGRALRGRVDADDACRNLKAKLAAVAGLRQHPAGADAGVAGERHFGRSVENPYPRGVGGVLGRQDEGRLRQVHFRGQRLHLLVGQPACIGEDSKGIAAEASVGEHVEGDKGIGSHGRRRIEKGPQA